MIFVGVNGPSAIRINKTNVEDTAIFTTEYYAKKLTEAPMTKDRWWCECYCECWGDQLDRIAKRSERNLSNNIMEFDDYYMGLEQLIAQRWGLA